MNKMFGQLFEKVSIVGRGHCAQSRVLIPTKIIQSFLPAQTILAIPGENFAKKAPFQMRRLLNAADTMDAEKMNKLATFISIAAQASRGPRIDPLDELEKDEDVQIAIADVEQLKKREEIIRKKTRLQRFRDTLIEWGRFTSYDGISHLVLAANNWIRLFWSILVFISLAAFFYLLFITLQNYLAYGTDVNLNFKYEQFHFPTITICNGSPYKLSLTKHNPGMKILLKTYNRLLAQGKI